MRRWVVFWLVYVLALGAAHAETVLAGPYQIQVDIASHEARFQVLRQGRPAPRVRLTVKPEMVEMDMGGSAQELLTDAAGRARAVLRTGMRGAWRLRLTVVGPAGGGSAEVPFNVGHAPASTAGVDARGVPTGGGKRPWLGNPEAEPEPLPVTPLPPEPSPEGLNLEEAVRLGLARNPDLLGAMQQLGIPDAAVVQAGLISNPVLSGEYRIGRRDSWELSLSQNIMDFLLRGARLDLAETEREATRQRLARIIFEQSAVIKAAYFQVQADQQQLQLTQTMLKAAAAAAELALRQRRANTVSQMDLVRQQAVQAEAQAELYEIEGKLQVDREILVRLLGTPENAETLAFGSLLPNPPESDPPLETLQTLAAERRQEVAAARLDERAARQGYSLASRFFGIDEVRVGVTHAREAEGLALTGPTVQLPLPLFNQNQGMRARYQAQEKIAQQALESALQNARFEVRQAYRQLQAARSQVVTARERTIPLRHQALKLAQQQFNHMFLGIYGLLTIYREELDARQQLVEALRGYWTARAALEKAVGADLPVGKEVQP